MILMLPLGIRLIIIIPSLLFFLGFAFKCTVGYSFERKLNEIEVSSSSFWEIRRLNRKSFLTLAALDSIFLVMANAVIFTFQFNIVEIGIIAFICGTIASVTMLVGVVTEHIGLTIGGLFIVTYIIGAELSYFLIVDVFTIENILTLEILGAILGGLLFFIIMDLCWFKLWVTPSADKNRKSQKQHKK